MNAQSQEPVFILRAGDRNAAAAVERYADLLEAQRAPAGEIATARHMAQRMRAWRMENPPAEPAPSAEMLPVAQPADDGTAAAMAEAGIEKGDEIEIPGAGPHVVGDPAGPELAAAPRKGRKS